MELNQLNWTIGEDTPDMQQIEAAKQKEYELDVQFLKTFSTPAGKEVLQWLISHTLDTPTWWPDADINKATANGFFREGQNSLIRQVKAKIQRAKDYQEKRK
jgi:hypothetical protein